MSKEHSRHAQFIVKNVLFPFYFFVCFQDSTWLFRNSLCGLASNAGVKAMCYHHNLVVPSLPFKKFYAGQRFLNEVYLCISCICAWFPKRTFDPLELVLPDMSHHVGAGN